MARLALELKEEGKKIKLVKDIAEGKKPKFMTRVHNRCKLCGKKGGYMRKFEICRICFRSLASQGKIMGVKKSSW